MISPVTAHALIASITFPFVPCIPSSEDRYTLPYGSNSSFKKSSSRYPSTMDFSQSSSFASCSIGGIPIPPPIRIAFPDSFIKPFPSGPRISTVSPACNFENSFVPFPAIRYTRRSVPASLSIPHKLIGLGSIRLPSFEYTETN